MKAYEAILIGASIDPQAFREWVGANGTCALGAMWKGAGIVPVTMTDFLFSLDDADKEAIQRFPVLLYHTNCPVQDCDWNAAVPTVHATIIHLNDFHQWTREQIAAWLKPIELQMAKAELEALVLAHVEPLLDALPVVLEPVG